MEFAPYPAQMLAQAQYETVPSSFNMGNVASALPDRQFRAYGQQPPPQQLSSSPNSNLLYQLHQNTQYTSQGAPLFNSTMQQQHGRATAMQFQQFQGQHQFPYNPGQSFQNFQSQYQPDTQQFYQQPSSGNYGQSYAMRGAPGFPASQVRLDSNLGTGLAYSAQLGLPKSMFSYLIRSVARFRSNADILQI